MKKKLYLMLPAMLALGFVRASANTITNGALIITSNLVFVLNQGSGAGFFTNQYESGDLIDYTLLTIDDKGRVCDRTSASTPEVFFRRFPENQSFQFRLIDTNGDEIPKTKYGLQMSQSVKVPKSVQDVTALKGRSAPVGAFPLFRPDEVFVMTNKGVYELELQIRLWAQTTNSSGPNYEVMGHFDKGIGTNAYFGVVTSETARVQIIKR